MEDQIFNSKDKDWEKGEHGLSKELVGKEYTDSSVLRIFCLKPGESFESHEHDYLQCMYFTTGIGKVSVDDRVEEIKPGTTVIVLPKQCHSVVNNGKEDMEIIVFESFDVSAQDTPFVDF